MKRLRRNLILRSFYYVINYDKINIKIIRRTFRHMLNIYLKIQYLVEKSLYITIYFL